MKAINFLFAVLLITACASNRHSEKSEELRSVALSKYEDYRSCYLASKIYEFRSSNNTVQITLDMTIQPDGTVSNASVIRSDVNDKDLHKCIVNHVRQLKFSPSAKEFGYVQPINFIPKTTP